MSTPLVTFVMPFRDPGPYLAPAIESVLAQTFTDFELIAIDDGSRDGSAEVLAGYARRDPRVRAFSQPALGLVPGLNRATTLARGAFIGRMDADDIALPQRLEVQLAYLERHPEITVLGTAFQVFTSRGLSWRVSRFPSSPGEIREALLTRNVLGAPTALVRRGALEAVGGYRPQFKDAEDHDIWLRLSERFEVANLPDVLHLYRWHGAQSTFARVEQQALSSLASVECARRRRAGLPDPTDRLDGVITLDTFEALGIDRAEVAATVAARTLDATRGLLEEGLVDQAEAMARRLDAREREGALRGRDVYVAARVAGWHVHVARGRLPQAVAELARYGRVAPVSLAAGVSRKLLRLARGRRRGRSDERPCGS